MRAEDFDVFFVPAVPQTSKTFLLMTFLSMTAMSIAELLPALAGIMAVVVAAFLCGRRTVATAAARSAAFRGGVAESVQDVPRTLGGMHAITHGMPKTLEERMPSAREFLSAETAEERKAMILDAMSEHTREMRDYYAKLQGQLEKEG